MDAPTYPLCTQLGILIVRLSDGGGDVCPVAELLATLERNRIFPEQMRIDFGRTVYAPDLETELQRIKGEWSATQ